MTSPNELNIYGYSIEQFRTEMEDSFTFKVSGPGLFVTSMLSDAQEELANGMTENARQTLNRAKWVLIEYYMKE